MVMGSYREEEEELFFDSREEICSDVELGSDGSGDSRSPSARFGNSVSGSSWYEVWRKDLESIHDRRNKFLKWMGLSADQNSAAGEESGTGCLEQSRLGAERMMNNSGAVLMTSGSEGCSLSTQSLASSRSNEAGGNFDDAKFKEKLVIRNLDDGTEFVVDELDQDGMLGRLRKVGSNLSLSFEEFQKTLGLSPVIDRLLGKYAEEVKLTAEVGKKVKETWLKKFNMLAGSFNRHETVDLQPKDVQLTTKATMQRVKVSPSRKQSKELSSLFAGQEFLAHKGSIWTMKFSLDGQYLASGGEDGIVRLWKVLEDERPDQFNILASGPSCPFSPLDDTSGSALFNLEEKLCKLKRHKSSDSTCTVFPAKVFKVQEKPLHEFQGHNAEILDLSWSKKRFLLSASADNTVRLWQVGCGGCLRVFSHTNYVTSVDFNPLDDNYFISGSIDGKVRIWEVQSCRVAGYTDIKDIVTAVCYRPSGKGGLVGSVRGNCFFYNVVDNQLELDAHVCLLGKKKLPNSRITGFQFSPSEPNKVVVTCADSVVRILCGTDVICKLKASGLRITANQIHASFTPDGKHIVSMSDHSNIYIWSYNDQNSSRMKSLRSCESFSSQNALIAIPWSGIETISETSLSPSSGGELHVNNGENGQASQKILGDSDHKMERSSPDWFSATRGFFLESLTRGSATWPEEKIPVLSPLTFSSTKYKSHYKLLKSACQHMLTSSPMWGLVIVTAGLDGRIRTYLNYGLPLRL